MSTGASRLARSFLCTHKKLISTMSMVALLTRTRAGMALMKPISLQARRRAAYQKAHKWQASP
jgi:hypothetical protein